MDKDARAEMKRNFRQFMNQLKEVEVPEDWKKGTHPNRYFPKLCYKKALDYVLGHYTIELNLVHGRYQPHMQGPSIGHAWIELPGEIVFDGVAQRFYDRASYYELQRAFPEAHYNTKDVTGLMIEHKNWGPWHEVQQGE